MNKLKIGAIREDIGKQLLISAGVKRKAIDRNNFAKNMDQQFHQVQMNAIAYGYDIRGIQERIPKMI